MQIVYLATDAPPQSSTLQALAQAAGLGPVQLAPVKAGGGRNLSDRIGALRATGHQSSDLGACIGHRRRPLIPEMLRNGVGGRDRLEDDDELAA